VSNFSYSIFFRNSFGLAKFIEVATFHPLYVQKSAKVSDIFKGGEKFCQTAVIFLTDSIFCCF
jgi:hypothetical protein